MRIVVLSGGVGGSRFVQGLLAATSPHDEIAVIANTADDIWLFGLRVCPDLDTLMYTLGGGIDVERGWGRTEETWNAKSELAAYGEPQAWFGLGDRDLATHLVRTANLRDGEQGLAQITRQLCRRWAAGTDLARVELLPMSEDEVETWVSTSVDGAAVAIHFQEFWIRYRAEIPVHAVTYRGVDTATPAPGVIDAIARADIVVLAPSNPVVSIKPILAVPGIREALRHGSASVVGVSPVIGGSAVRGMSDQLLAGLGIESSAEAVALLYGARGADGDGVLDSWLVDEVDAASIQNLEKANIRTRAAPLWMRDRATTRQLAVDALSLGLTPGRLGQPHSE